jgi:hypothetical protein
MFRIFVIVTLLLAALRSSQASIDFTPVVEEYASQGFVYEKVTLKAEKRVIKFVPPMRWNVRGGKNLLQLNPPGQGFVEATISATPLSSPTPFNDATVEALKQQALSSAPPASQFVQLVRYELNPVPMAPNPSLEVVISYVSLGRTFEKSTIFVQTADLQLVFRLSAPKEEFSTLNQAFRASIGSWQWIEPAASAPVAKAQSSPAPAERQ